VGVQISPYRPFLWNWVRLKTQF